TLDGVIVTTPVQTHVGILMDLLDSGKIMNYFVEEPLSASLAESTRICDAARSADCIHMVGFQKRYGSTFAKAKKIISSGDLGKLQFFSGHIYSSDISGAGEGWRLKKGGGVVVDLGPHIIDLVIWYFGQPVRTNS